MDDLNDKESAGKDEEDASQLIGDTEEQTEGTSTVALPCCEAVDNLKDGLLNRFAPEILEQQARVRELTRHQDVLLETLQQEETQLREFGPAEDMSLLFTDIRTYYTKLVALKKEMNMLKDKSEKVKRRALRLHIQRQKEELHKAHLKERERELEREITARPAPHYFANTKSPQS